MRNKRIRELSPPLSTGLSSLLTDAGLEDTEDILSFPLRHLRRIKGMDGTFFYELCERFQLTKDVNNDQSYTIIMACLRYDRFEVVVEINKSCEYHKAGSIINGVVIPTPKEVI